MTLIAFLRAVAFCGIVSFLCACAGITSQGRPASSDPRDIPSRPNIVLVLFEDLGQRFGAYGDPVAYTPGFDLIASEGVLYTNVFVSAPVCAPSRASLITGRYAHTIGAQHMRTSSATRVPTGGPQNYLAVPDEQIKAFPELLRASGYYTSNDTKTDYQFGEPFTIWDVSGEGADWSGRAEGQSFFHMYTIPTTHESAIWPVDMRPTSPLEAYVIERNARVFADREARTDSANVEVPPYLPDTPEVRRDIATHYDNIAFSDQALRGIYARLQNEGLLDNTILIVSSDHGDGLPRMKRSLYDSGLRVPFVIRYPDGLAGGTQNNELISFVDIAPTILSWAGAGLPAWLQGSSFADESRQHARTYVYAGLDRMDNEPNWRRAVRDQRFKYIRNYLPSDPYFVALPFRDSQPSMKALWAGLGAGTLPEAARRLFDPLPEHQLYDTLSDPHEVRNLAEDPAYAGELARMRQALDDWRERVGDMSTVSEVEMIAGFWPDGKQPVTGEPIAEIITQDGYFHVSLRSLTGGASIGYQMGDATDVWRLYTGPVSLPEGVSMRARAIRYGFAESAVVEIATSR